MARMRHWWRWHNRSRNILNGNANLDLCGVCSILRVGGGGGGRKEDVASLERHLRSPIVKVRSHVRVHDSKYVDPRRSVGRAASP